MKEAFKLFILGLFIITIILSFLMAIFSLVQLCPMFVLSIIVLATMGYVVKMTYDELDERDD